jgi:hypothetical protein
MGKVKKKLIVFYLNHLYLIDVVQVAGYQLSRAGIQFIVALGANFQIAKIIPCNCILLPGY